jgi:hypothetical protein
LHTIVSGSGGVRESQEDNRRGDMESNTIKGRRVKRKQVQSEDGWTVVAGSGSNAPPSTSKARDARPTRVVDGLTVEKLAAEFKDMEKRWRKSACAKNLEKMLELRDWSVTGAVCIGIGSFSLDWEHRWRSMWQLVLFVGVVELREYSLQTPALLYLQLTTTVRESHPTLTLHAQEPAFTPLDISFLATLSITTISSDIESHITPTSFVFAPFVDWYLLLPIFLRNKDPELYIGNEILGDYKVYANTKEKEEALKESNEVGGRFVVGRERRKVPGFEEHGSALEGLMVYWREDDEDDE